jgi:hypothetical protein
MLPLWSAIAGLGLSAFQALSGHSAQQRAEQAAREGGMSPEEVNEMEQRGMAGAKLDLRRRGLLDSGLLPGARAAVTGEVALARAKSRLPLQGSYIQMLQQRSQQPNFLGSLIPLVMQYGLRGPGGSTLIKPYQPPGATPPPATTTTK